MARQRKTLTDPLRARKLADETHSYTREGHLEGLRLLRKATMAGSKAREIIQEKIRTIHEAAWNEWTTKNLENRRTEELLRKKHLSPKESTEVFQILVPGMEVAKIPEAFEQ